MEQGCTSPRPTLRAYPELPMDIVTIIVQYTQDLENSDLWERLSTDPFYQEHPSDTRKRIRALLKKGLVSKLWRDAISDPTLWTTFLNASMDEDQFLRVVAHTGDLPVAINLKAQNGSILSDSTIRAINTKSPRVTRLLLDISSTAPGPAGPTGDIKTLTKLLEYPMPSLSILSLCGTVGQRLELPGPLASRGAFGGVQSPIRHLELTGIKIAPRAFCTTLVSLSLGLDDITLMRAQIAPWMKLAAQGDMPYLKVLTIRALFNNVNDERRLPAPSDTQSVVIPDSIRKVRIAGSTQSCIYMGMVLWHRMPRTFEMAITYFSFDYATLADLPTLFAHLRGFDIAEELNLTIRENLVSLVAKAADRSAKLIFVPSWPSVASELLRVVNVFFGDPDAICGFFGSRDPRACDHAWLKLDIALHQRNLRGSTEWDQTAAILQSFAKLFQGYRNLRNVHVVQYIVARDDAKGLEQWEDSLRVFQHHINSSWTPYSRGDETYLLFPHLKRLRITEPPQGLGREFHRSISDFIWDHSESQINGPTFEQLEIVRLSGDLDEVNYELPILKVFRPGFAYTTSVLTPLQSVVAPCFGTPRQFFVMGKGSGAKDTYSITKYRLILGKMNARWRGVSPKLLYHKARLCPEEGHPRASAYPLEGWVPTRTKPTLTPFQNTDNADSNFKGGSSLPGGQARLWKKVSPPGRDWGHKQGVIQKHRQDTRMAVGNGTAIPQLGYRGNTAPPSLRGWVGVEPPDVREQGGRGRRGLIAENRSSGLPDLQNHGVADPVPRCPDVQLDIRSLHAKVEALRR
ncbi:hypothetical protein FA13DRAFT_1778090 [Coprinellus micaceus]|uniref:F-box domain-containing protein n=1 Tax=Coprinellus micaceus TaxID=71717 RepID=A0A4Y7SQB1_COPMI|nr:hypothetical protein FA13DRAFT_1778090 [Coprinellus micaceus]